MSVVGKKEITKMNRTASQIQGVFSEMQTQLNILDTEIKREEADKISYEVQLKKLNEKKNDLIKSIDAKEKWVKEAETGNFAVAYGEIQKDIEQIYNKAKAGHKQGIKILENDFNYHPTFKRVGDGFHASSTFIPK